jgi:hypothetical protein
MFKDIKSDMVNVYDQNYRSTVSLFNQTSIETGVISGMSDDSANMVDVAKASDEHFYDAMQVSPVISDILMVAADLKSLEQGGSEGDASEIESLQAELANLKEQWKMETSKFSKSGDAFPILNFFKSGGGYNGSLKGFKPGEMSTLDDAKKIHPVIKLLTFELWMGTIGGDVTEISQADFNKAESDFNKSLSDALSKVEQHKELHHYYDAHSCGDSLELTETSNKVMEADVKKGAESIKLAEALNKSTEAAQEQWEDGKLGEYPEGGSEGSEGSETLPIPADLLEKWLDEDVDYQKQLFYYGSEEEHTQDIQNCLDGQTAKASMESIESSISKKSAEIAKTTEALSNDSKASKDVVESRGWSIGLSEKESIENAESFSNFISLESKKVEISSHEAESIANEVMDAGSSVEDIVKYVEDEKARLESMLKKNEVEIAKDAAMIEKMEGEISGLTTEEYASNRDMHVKNYDQTIEDLGGFITIWEHYKETGEVPAEPNNNNTGIGGYMMHNLEQSHLFDGDGNHPEKVIIDAHLSHMEYHLWWYEGANKPFEELNEEKLRGALTWVIDTKASLIEYFDKEAKDNADLVVKVNDAKVLLENKKASKVRFTDQLTAIDAVDDSMVKALSENIKNVLEVVSDARETVKLTEDEVNSFGDQVQKELDEGLSILDAQKEEAQKSIVADEETIKALDANIKQITESKENAESEIKEAREKLADVTKQVESHELNMKATKDAYEAESTKALEEHESWMAKNQSEKDAQKAEVEKLTSDVAKASDDVDAAQLDVEAKESSLKEKEAERDLISDEAQRESFNEEFVSPLKDAYSEAENNLADKADVLSQSTQDKLASAETLAKIESEKDAQQAGYQDSKDKAKEAYDKFYEEANKQSDEYSEMVIRTGIEIDKNTDHISRIEGELAAREEQKASLNSQIEQTKVDVKDLDSKFNSREEIIKNSQHEVVSSKDSIADAASRLIDAEKMLDELKTKWESFGEVAEPGDGEGEVAEPGDDQMVLDPCAEISKIYNLIGYDTGIKGAMYPRFLENFKAELVEVYNEPWVTSHGPSFEAGELLVVPGFNQKFLRADFEDVFWFFDGEENERVGLGFIDTVNENRMDYANCSEEHKFIELLIKVYRKTEIESMA